MAIYGTLTDFYINCDGLLCLIETVFYLSFMWVILLATIVNLEKLILSLSNLLIFNSRHFYVSKVISSSCNGHFVLVSI